MHKQELYKIKECSTGEAQRHPSLAQKEHETSGTAPPIQGVKMLTLYIILRSIIL